MTSCLNRTLISDAVSGTGAKVSLLIQALTPLCPPSPPLVEVAANHSATVVVGYICGFLPWTVIALFDFISAKWKTVRTTRRLGYLHLTACIVPMLFVIGYAVLQAVSGDYKEMMTAVIAVLLSFYHVARTLWGLVQLRQYVNWCTYTLQCIRATQPKSECEEWVPHWANKDEIEISTDLDEELMVNEEIMDNEFTGRDLSVSYSLTDRSMTVSNPAVCTMRWAAALLCSHGHHWKSTGCKPVPRDLEPLLIRTLFHIDLSQSNAQPFSFLYFSGLPSFANSICGAYGSTISNGNLLLGVNAFETLQFEFDNIVSSFPSCDDRCIEQNRVDARLELAEFVLAARTLSPRRLVSIASQCSERRDAFFCGRQFEDAFDLLQDQIGMDNPVYSTTLHWISKLPMVPHLNAKSNAFFIQTSAHVDHALSISLGYFKPKQSELECLQDVNVDIFERYNNLLQSYHCSDPLNNWCMLGVTLDVIRTLLAEYVLSSKSPPDPATWHPEIHGSVFSFTVSEALLRKLEDRLLVHNYYLNNFQHVLQESCIACQRFILESSQNSTDLPALPAMIYLFLLSYPAVSAKPLKVILSREIIEVDIQPMWVPQNLRLSLLIHTKTRNSSLRIVCDKDDTKFDWEKWINCALALLKAHNQGMSKRRESNNGFYGPCEMIRKADLSKPMLTLTHDEEDEILSQLPGKLHVWTGWPIFDVGFCQFELGQWMEACGPIGSYSRMEQSVGYCLERELFTT